MLIMDIFDIELKHETGKLRILTKLEKIKDKWKKFFKDCQGVPEAEMEAIQMKLEIQLTEMEAHDKFKEIDEEISRLKNS